MAFHKKELFTKQDNEIADFAKALSHPARLDILSLLINEKSCICGSIVDKLPLSQSTVSQHLKELKSAGLILGEIEGQKVCYCINKEVFDQMAQKTIDKLQEFQNLLKKQ